MRTLPFILILFLFITINIKGQFKKLSYEKMHSLCSGELVIIDLNFSSEFKSSLKNIFDNYITVSFSKEVPSGNKAILHINSIYYKLPYDYKAEMRCLQISKGQENILVPMPSIEYSSDKKLNGTFSEGQIILASRLIKNCIDWSIKNGKSYDFDTYFKKSAKANKSKLSKYTKVYIREEDVLFESDWGTAGRNTVISEVSKTNSKMIPINISDLDQKIKSNEKFAISYIVKTSDGTFKLLIDGLSGEVLFKFKHEVTSYWDGFNKAALKAISKALE